MDMQSYLKDLKANQKILKALTTAYKEEAKFLKGIDAAAGIKVRAYIEQESGFWIIEMHSEVGMVIFAGEDGSFSKVQIISTPSKKRIAELRNLSHEKGTLLTGSDDDLQLRMRVSFYLDMTNIQEMQKAKKVFANDFVLSAIRFADSQRKAYEMLPTFLRDYRRVFARYHKKYSFLWQGTPYKSAISLYEELEKL